MLATVMYFQLNEAVYIGGCKVNSVIISNELTPSATLNIHCFNGKKDMGIANLHYQAYPYKILFDDPTLGFGKTKVYRCILKHGRKLEYYYDIQVYKGASAKQRCGASREWTAKVDGIYFRKDGIEPMVRVLPWKKG